MTSKNVGHKRMILTVKRFVLLAGGMGAAKVYEDESIIWTPTVSEIRIIKF